jgi:YD repeat-containing protein
MSNKFECALGCHNYTISDKNDPTILICENCKRKGYRKIGYEVWYDYNDRGNIIHQKDFTGYEVWYDYDDKGNYIHRKESGGYEGWRDNNGSWVNKKPKNWKYEKYVK